MTLRRQATTDDGDEEIGRKVLFNRNTGEVVADIPIYASDWPFEEPAPTAPLLKYGDWFKFESMVLRRQLYYRRADKQLDELEGRFAEANRRDQTSLWQRFRAAVPMAPLTEENWQAREAKRYFTFLSCWNMNVSEVAWMWQEYTTRAESVVFRTTAHLLNSQLQPPAYRLFRVQYAGQDIPRPEWHSLGPYIFKGREFAKEREVRSAIIKIRYAFSTDDDQFFGEWLPIEPAQLVQEVIVHPHASLTFVNKVKAFCAEHLPECRVRRSVIPKAQVRARQEH